MSEPSLSRVAAAGAVYLTASQIARQAIQLVTLVVLARLLVPSDFGLMTMAMVVIGLVLLIKDLGLGAAIIQRQDISTVFVATIFWASVAISAAFAVAMVVLAPIGAVWFDEPALEPILRVLSLVVFVSGVGVAPQALLERRLAFGRVATAELLGTGCGALVGIGAALGNAGVWSLVAQSIASAMTITLLVVLWSEFVPGRRFSRSLLSGVARFSAPLVGYNVLNFASRNADYALIGRYLGAEPLGQYTVAYRIMLYPLQTIAGVLGRVMYPVYSRLQHDNPEMRRHYLALLATVGFLAFPVVFGTMAMSERIIAVVFGDQWAPAAVPLALLAPVGLIQVIVTTTGPLYIAKGRTDLLFAWSVASGIVTIGGFIVGVRAGIVGVAAAYLIVTIAMAYPALAIPSRLIELRLRDVLAAVARPFTCGLLMFITVRVAGLIVDGPIDDPRVFVGLVMVGALVYLVSSLLFNRRQFERLLLLRAR